jgi:predicted GNAT family N-acyltransferase
MIEIRPAASDQDVEAAVDIQLDVFSKEQGIPDAVCRQGNAGACHVLAFDGDTPVGTARLMCGQDGEAELARVAVLPSRRNDGIGRQLVLALEEIAAREGVRGITLRPHRHLEAFYEHLGYSRTDGSIEIVAGHELITMYKLIGD